MATVDPRTEVPPDILKAAVNREIAERRERAAASRTETRDERQTAQPARNRNAAITSGAYRRWQRPTAHAEDRRFVPGALRHFRRVHDLTPAQAQARIGYSPKSSTWRQWEEGIAAPPYLALLKIISSVGLGYWQDHGLPFDGLTGEHRLEAMARAHTADTVRRRQRRRERRSRGRDATPPDS